MQKELVMSSKQISLVALVAGVVLVVVAIVYFVEPSKSLPSFFPGHYATSVQHATRHGMVALFVGLVFFLVAWISSRISTE